VRFWPEIRLRVHRVHYNEPTIWGEYIIDICKEARKYGLKTVMVTMLHHLRGFHDIYDHIDAANVDLKASREFLREAYADASYSPVLETLAWLKK